MPSTWSLHEPGLGAGQRGRAIVAPLRHSAAQIAQQLAQRGRRQRRVLGHHHVHEHVVRRLRVLGRRRGLAHRVQPDAPFTPRHPQQPAIVQAIEQLRAGAGAAAEPIGGGAERQRRVHLARVRHASVTHHLQHPLRVLPLSLRPRARRRARVHQRVQLTRDEAGVDEEVLLDGQPRVASLQIAGAIAGDAVPQRQVLGPRRRADRVGLHEAQPGQRPRQRGGPEQRAVDRLAPQVHQRLGHGHGAMMHAVDAHE
jgi:hypothetical protein